MGKVGTLSCTPSTLPCLRNPLAEKKVAIDGVMGQRSTTELMLLHGADVNVQTSEGLSALMIAAGRDRQKAVKRLLELKAQVNMTSMHGQNALLMAAAHDLSAIARTLIVAGAEVNHADEKKETALSIADRFNFKEFSE